MFTKIRTINMRTTIIDGVLVVVPFVLALWFHSVGWATTCAAFTAISLLRWRRGRK